MSRTRNPRAGALIAAALVALISSLASLAEEDESMSTKTPQFEIVETAPQPTAIIRFKVAPAELSQKLAEVLPAVYRYLTEMGVQKAGQPFSRYHSFGEDEIDMEAGIPTPEPVAGRGEIVAGELPGGDVANTWHVGPYDQLSVAHQALSEWVASEGRQAIGGPWEVYVTDPGAEPDPAKWRTQVFLALESKPTP